MDGINDKYDIELLALTPLAIGAGAEKDWVEGVDFIVENGKLFKLNMQKIAKEGIDLSLLSAYFIDKNTVAIRKLIGKKLETVSDFSIPFPFSGATNPIKAFMKNQLTGKPVVPGSSIKGAVRSIIIERLSKGNTAKIRTKTNEIIGVAKDGADYMRFVKFSDIEFEKTALINTKIFNLQRDNGGRWQGGWKHKGNNTSSDFNATGFNTIYEMIAPQSWSMGSMMLSGKMFEQLFQSGLSKSDIYIEDKKHFLRKTSSAPTALFRAINEHTEAYLKKEKEFFSKYEAGESQRILDNIEELLSEVEASMKDDTSCVFKMSAGSGFHSITGDWQFGDYWSGLLDRKRNKDDAKPKSRKIAIDGDNFFLMGFVKMSIAGDDAMREYESRKQEEQRQREKEFEEWRLATEKQRIELKAAERLKQMELDYDKAIAEANAYEQNPEYDEECALELYRKAATIWPEGSRHKERVNSLEIIISGRAKAKEEEANRGAATSAAIKAGLSNLDRKKMNDDSKYVITSFKQVKNAVDSWLKKSEKSSIPEEEDHYLETTLHRIFNSLGTKREEKIEKKNLSEFSSAEWKTVTQWCGEERAKHIFEVVTKS